MVEGEFHLRDGWYFKRLDDGSVRMRWRDNTVRTAARELTVPAAEWASVVAAVCARGETGEAYQEALTLHG